MKRVFAIAILATALFDASMSYAWVCTFQGPMGALYSRDGRGYGRNVAYNRALAACRANKVHNGVPCVFRGCR